MQRDVGKTEGRTDIWTDMTKLIVAFRNFANEPKEGQHFCLYQLTEISFFQVSNSNKKPMAETEPVVK